MISLDFSDGINTFYLVSQAFALASFIFNIIAMQRKRKPTLLNMDVMAGFCAFMHYAFLGAWAGMISKFISTIRNAIAAYISSKNLKTPKILPIVFVALYIAIGFFAFDSPLTILPILAPCVYTIAIYTCDITKIRYAGLATAIIWLIYDICVFSVVGATAQTILIVNIIIAICRFRKKKNNGSKKR